MNALEQLKQVTVVVADTGDFECEILQVEADIDKIKLNF